MTLCLLNLLIVYHNVKHILDSDHTKKKCIYLFYNYLCGFFSQTLIISQFRDKVAIKHETFKKKIAFAMIRRLELVSDQERYNKNKHSSIWD